MTATPAPAVEPVVRPKAYEWTGKPTDGKREGTWVRHRPNGSVEQTQEYRDGLLEGTPSGGRTARRRGRSPNRDEVPDGTVRQWDETGKALPEEEWRRGRQVR